MSDDSELDMPAASGAGVVKTAFSVDADGPIAIDELAQHSGLSKAKLKDVMNKGAVHLTRGRKRQRLRRAQMVLRKGDRLELFYDPALIALKPGDAKMLADHRHYSLWYKPAGMLAQGTDWGDHCSLLRVVDVARHHNGAWLVHRLDREAHGIMIVAHSGEAAGKLSALFTKNTIEKLYRVTVIGEAPESGLIELPLDGKESLTRYTRVAFANGESDLDVRIETGRLHQIRRHLAMVGLPVKGDARYGHGKAGERLHLCAVRLRYHCPFARRELMFEHWPEGMLRSP